MDDIVEVIPATMERFFGGSGKMIKPSTETVKMLLDTVPLGHLMTTTQLRQSIALLFSVQATCPSSLMKSLVHFSKEDDAVCFWRVIKPKGELINTYFGGVDVHAKKLQREGFMIDFDKQKPTVIDFKAKLIKND